MNQKESYRKQGEASGRISPVDAKLSTIGKVERIEGTIKRHTLKVWSVPTKQGGGAIVEIDRAIINSKINNAGDYDTMPGSVQFNYMRYAELIATNERAKYEIQNEATSWLTNVIVTDESLSSN